MHAERGELSGHSTELKSLLLADGMIGDTATLLPLAGGVSSEIYLVTDGGRQLVVKRALPRLKVAQPWFADTSRNATEARYLEYVGAFRPAHVPRLLHASREHGYFAMEYLGGGWENWKQTMLEGRLEPSLAAAAGSLLGAIHARSAGDAATAAAFQTLENFEQLRIEPYLLATGKCHPRLRNAFEAEAARLRSQREVLTHGDFSPKNILVSGGRLVILDCEAAWYGDAAFDVAFLLNHLFLKSGVVMTGPWPEMIEAAWSAYVASRFANPDDAGSALLEANVARLLPMLMLARIDGKSPVEYLSEPQRARVRAFSTAMISRPCPAVGVLADQWFRRERA